MPLLFIDVKVFPVFSLLLQRTSDHTKMAKLSRLLASNYVYWERRENRVQSDYGLALSGRVISAIDNAT